MSSGAVDSSTVGALGPSDGVFCSLNGEIDICIWSLTVGALY